MSAQILAKRDIDGHLCQLRGIFSTTVPDLASALLSGQITNGKRSTVKLLPDSVFFIPRISARPVETMSLARTAWVKLNRLRTGVGIFHSSMHKWGLAPSPNFECGASEQNADYDLIACFIHRTPHGARGLSVLDDEIRCWLNTITVSI